MTKFVIKHKDGSYYGGESPVKFSPRAEAVRTHGKCCEDWQENARIVRLKPKAKAAMIPVPTVKADGYSVHINGEYVVGDDSQQEVERIAARIRKALGLPEQP